jgi:hypothetical protein
MGRRSRKRGVSERGGGTAVRDRPARAAQAATSAPAAPRRPAPRRPPGPERPKALWHPVPVTEVAILAGTLALLVGFSRGSGGVVPMAVGFGVLVLAVGELSVREHFSGFRSHALLLALLPVVVLEGLLYAFVGVSGPLLLGIAVPVFVSLAFIFRARYREARMDRPLPRS